MDLLIVCSLLDRSSNNWIQKSIIVTDGHIIFKVAVKSCTIAHCLCGYSNYILNFCPFRLHNTSHILGPSICQSILCTAVPSIYNYSKFRRIEEYFGETSVQSGKGNLWELCMISRFTAKKIHFLKRKSWKMQHNRICWETQDTMTLQCLNIRKNVCP